MVEIIPVINVKTKQKFKERLKILSGFSGTFQVDVADGIFTQWKNWNSPEELKKIKKIRRRFELHLMINNPEEALPLWLESYPKRVVVHLEVVRDFSFLLQQCQNWETELALAIKPQTKIEELKKYLPVINFVTILGVDPGPSGQKFNWNVLKKISRLRKDYPNLDIELDGGVDEIVIPEAIKSGANILAIGSVIFGSENPKKKLIQLQRKFCQGKFPN